MSHMVKNAQGYDVKVPSQGQANFNTVGAAGGIGWIAEKTGILNGLPLNWGRNGGGCCSPMDQPVTRYELGMEQALAAKDSEIALLKSNIFTDQKITETYKELRGMISTLQEVAAQQAVTNTAFNSAMQSMDYKFTQAIALEAERRECADGKIVNYLNSVFTPKLVQPYAAGTEGGTPAAVYNPLCNCKC